MNALVGREVKCGECAIAAAKLVQFGPRQPQSVSGLLGNREF
jgi:hypothetical protein